MYVELSASGVAFNWLYTLQIIQVGLNNPVLVAVAGFKDFLRHFICFGDHGNILNKVLWFLF